MWIWPVEVALVVMFCWMLFMKEHFFGDLNARLDLRVWPFTDQ